MHKQSIDGPYVERPSGSLPFKALSATEPGGHENEVRLTANLWICAGKPGSMTVTNDREPTWDTLSSAATDECPPSDKATCGTAFSLLLPERYPHDSETTDPGPDPCDPGCHCARASFTTGPASPSAMVSPLAFTRCIPRPCNQNNKIETKQSS